MVAPREEEAASPVETADPEPAAEGNNRSSQCQGLDLGLDPGLHLSQI